MNAGSWIAIYLPLFIIFFIILPQQRAVNKAVLLKIRKRKGVAIMTNELIKKYIGKKCLISTGTFGTTVKGIIIGVNENWLEVETKKGNELINAEFIQCIKMI
ncbi:DUF6897 domain-containing protein [Desulfosporosinus nitroreducens]|uniref:Preprotein translocase subunit YajC n=1 Tax=Desulfosporosinus nitroreducens TaxID=2018668 RepID=A0ABT8QX24_9FIRM|nr:hypothetical protein [Desulfosporosinus nitroreducens]MDO0825897.1 hypothetical protein [Desulfosporosinus nitroreducens]